MKARWALLLAVAAGTLWLTGGLWPQANPAAAGPARGTQNAATDRRYYMLATVADLDIGLLNVFLQSWKRFSPHTHLVLFVEEGTVFADHGVPVEVIRFSQPKNVKLVKLQRYALYQPYLEKLRKQGVTGGVVLTDARDVFIQSDPWQDPLVQQMVVEDSMLFTFEGGLEHGEGFPIKDSVANVQWLRWCFGDAVKAELSALPISCSGVTVGGVGAVTAYVDQLLDVAFNVATDICRDKGGCDQGIHNYMVHYLGPRGKLKFKHHVRKNWESPVQTGGYGWPYYFDRFGTYKRVNGTTPTIVHQYDRRGAAAQIMRGVYPVFPQGYQFDGPNATTNSILPHCLGATAVTAGQAAATE